MWCFFLYSLQIEPCTLDIWKLHFSMWLGINRFYIWLQIYHPKGKNYKIIKCCLLLTNSVVGPTIKELNYCILYTMRIAFISHTGNVQKHSNLGIAYITHFSKCWVPNLKQPYCIDLQASMQFHMHPRTNDCRAHSVARWKMFLNYWSKTISKTL